MINNISSALSSLSRSIATAVRSNSFSVSPQKVSLTPIKINSPFSPAIVPLAQQGFLQPKIPPWYQALPVLHRFISQQQVVVLQPSHFRM